LDIKDSRLQVVIQDNGESDKLGKLVEARFQDARLIYHYNNRILSFVGNFSEGISLCTGDYVTIIGDDDGINPQILQLAELAAKNGIDAVTPSLPIVYFWPDSGVPSANQEGKLRISSFSNVVRFYDTPAELKKLLNNGCQSYLSLKLAKVYHGIVKRSVLEDIHAKTGKYIGGLSPDIYLSIASSALIKKVLFIDYPLTISGICKKSGSSDSATGKHTGDLKDAPHFIGHNNYRWSEEVPSFYSVETIWADSALAAIDDLNCNKLKTYFDIDFLSGYCYSLYPQFKSIIKNNLSKNLKVGKNSFSTKLHLQKGLIKFKVRNFWLKVLAKTVHRKSEQVYDSVPNIQKAVSIIEQTIQKNGVVLFENLERGLANKNQ
jgi:glycosyltransferase involved in cell wall biosynthesis